MIILRFRANNRLCTLTWQCEGNRSHYMDRLVRSTKVYWMRSPYPDTLTQRVFRKSGQMPQA